jgi:hypothetical protein
MCIFIYLASDKPLPHWEWPISRWKIGVAGPMKNDGDTIALFSKPHVYSVSTTRTGDGCGFQDDDLAGQQEREALADLLERCWAVVGELELFARYVDPKTGAPMPTSYDRVTPSDFRTWRRFVPDEFLIVSDAM